MGIRKLCLGALAAPFFLSACAWDDGQTPPPPVFDAALAFDARTDGGQISKHIYGQFAEHLGTLIYGGIWVGPDSETPNRNGMRCDVVDALKKLEIPNLRWPGGCFAETYHWMDGVGPERKPIVNTNWGGVTEDNSFGTHEFLELCEQLGCEPIICVNVSTGTPEEMNQWMQYVNDDGDSEMAKLRRANGRDKPWGVKFWGIGNENWGCGGKMTAEKYTAECRRYIESIEPQGGINPFTIACGPNTGDHKWTETLMEGNHDIVDAISPHYYTFWPSWEEKSHATGFNESGWISILRKALRLETLLEEHSAIMDKYDPEKKVAVAWDEWGTWFKVEEGTNAGFLYQQNTLRDAMVAGLTLNIFNNHCDRVRMANIAQVVNVLQAMILTGGDKMLITPTYHVFDMYQGHKDATLLPVALVSPDYQFDGEAIPAMSASASRAKDGSILITLCNIHHHENAHVTCQIAGLDNTSITGTILTSDDFNAHNTFEEPNTISPAEFTDFALDGTALTINMPRQSIVALTLK